MSGTGRKITKRACDGCKIRKIKCSGLAPCDGCVAVRISCTYLKHPSTRGPRKLRMSTLQEIAQTQQRHQRKSVSSSPTETAAPIENTAVLSAPLIIRNEPIPRIPIASLVLPLCVYRLRMFPVWPVVKVEEVIASLQQNEEDIETYGLANAVGAATVAQLKLTRSSLGGDAVTDEMMEAECQRTRADIGSKVNLTALRTAFFLHVYHENQEAGGLKSLLYLREAITIGQMMGLHRESSYMALSAEEQQIRRRILWLLFVTERGVAMLHKLPVVLKPNISFPSMDRDDETFVLPAFQKLVNLFWIFDQSGAFDILQDSDANVFGFGNVESPSRTCLDLLQRKLREVPVEGNSINDVQTADICVTRQWMRAVLWRFSVNHGLLSSTDQVSSLSYPFLIAKEFLGVISQLPSSAIEAHGQGMELKIYEIASSVTDAIAKRASSHRNSSWSSSSSMDRPGDILNQLHRILSSCRGGNKTLVSMLCSKIAEVQNGRMLLLEPSVRRIEEEDNEEQWQAENVSNELEFNIGMDLGDMNGTTSFNDRQEQRSLGNFNEEEDDSLASQRPVPSNSHIPLDLPQTAHLSQQHQQSPDQQLPFIPFPASWPFQEPTGLVLGTDTRETALYSQSQNNFSVNSIAGVSGVSSFGIPATEEADVMERLMATGDMWDVGMGLGVGMGMEMGSGPEAVEQWN